MYQNRDTLKQLFKYFPDFAVMVEVGSYQGGSALVWSQKFVKVYCVDPWLGILGKDIAVREGTYGVFLERTKDVSNIISVRKSSKEASKNFVDNSLDFVYIDALHDYESVKADILLWLPKIKPGGYIGGHDYGFPSLPEVKQAVDDTLGLPKIFDTEFSWLVPI